MHSISATLGSHEVFSSFFWPYVEFDLQPFGNHEVNNRLSVSSLKEIPTMKTENAAHYVLRRLNPFILIGVFIILAAVVAVPFYTARSRSLPTATSGAP